MFVTTAGVQVPAVTTDQMREVDRIAVDETGPTLLQMMENAGRNLAMHVMSHLGSDWRQESIVVLAGTGGNGGGGICAARHLVNRGGDVTVVASDEDGFGDAPRWQLAIYRHAGGRVSDPSDSADVECSLVVDALLGYSLTGAPRGPVRDLISWADDGSAPVISLDVPSGVDATTGTAPGVHVAAASTVTLALPKTGLGRSAGVVWLADLGIPKGAYERMGLEVPRSLFGDAFLVELRRQSEGV